jgi:hypothetical protein
MLLVLAAAPLGLGIACSLGPSSSACGASSQVLTCGSFDAVVAMSDYVSSDVGLASVAGALDHSCGVGLGADPVLASSAGRLFWIARDLGQIIELDTDCLRAKQTFDALDPVPPGSTRSPSPTNPYDVAVAPDGSLWIARFDVPTLLVLEANGSRRTTIDLSSLDEVDGNPNMNSIRILDPSSTSSLPSDAAAGSMGTFKAYVSLEILDDNMMLDSTRPSKVVRINLETRKPEAVLVLQGKNPFSSMVQLGNQLYLADAGSWHQAAGQKDAGIERIDTASFSSKLLATGVALGGHASELAVTERCGAVIVAGPLPNTPTSLVQFDPASGEVGRTVIPTTPAFTLAGLAWVGSDKLLVGDQGTPPASPFLHVFDADPSSCSLHAESTTLPMLLPPVGLLALR